MNSTLFKYFLIYMIIFSGIIFPISFSYSQNNIITEIKGVVVDSKTNEPMPFVSVVFVDKNIGTRTDFDGKFILNSREASKKIKFSYMGYASEIKNVIIGKRQVINCKLNHELKRLDEVVIKPEKIKYKNKDNPAVKLIENVIQNKAKNRKEGFDYIEYNKYEKTQFALSNINEKFMQKKSFKKFQFVFDNIDTTKLEGKKILPIYLKETLSKYYYRKSPKDSKEI
ncbi:MAG: carboxypeptidase-like regulatory domain-containing protein, partial [Bacteroidota bacterium]|nr:carboxypeptidase-like regulatory domain-containing protein [Bacteroidota bacterium]